ncbi:response regulator [Rhodococcus rhodnii LMG 5362]|uniref:Response regulator n=1 Tax=Rhodococcus rhodnii LMG 5362 TaxID=1273125 RepID=R7WQX4_9NOCA|nr:response regulator [Rhodococcus rhodnii LMG 5362]
MNEDHTDAPPPTVMVVDDHPIWRDGVARDLAEAGLTVVATADGVAAARRRAAATRPAVVLMDMHLPDGNGADATAAVLEASPGSTVLVLSALSHRTVENHVQATLRKLQLANRVELARYAIERGLD